MLSFSQYLLSKFLQAGEKERERMKREIKRSIWSEKRKKKKNNLGKKIKGVNKTRLHRGSDAAGLGNRPKLNLRMILL
jgi:hypothetical protein